MATCIEEATEQAENAVYNQTLYLQEIKMSEQEDLESYYSAIRLKTVVGSGGGAPQSSAASVKNN